MTILRILYLLALALLAGCASNPDADTPLHELSSDAQAANGDYICWKEHLIDDSKISGGVPLRGPAALALADFDRDGIRDLVAAYSGSGHLRIAYGEEESPEEWVRLSLAEGKSLEGSTGLATGDWNSDGWPDLVVLGDSPVYLENPASPHRGFRWRRLDDCDGCVVREAGDATPAAAAALAGAARADIDEDGDSDLLGGTADGLIAWFQNSAEGWRQRDIVRRARGAYPAWAAADLDGDGDVDFIGVRADSGKLDGLFWLEQQRARSAVQRHQPARAEGDSEALPAL